MYKQRAWVNAARKIVGKTRMSVRVSSMCVCASPFRRLVISEGCACTQVYTHIRYPCTPVWHASVAALTKVTSRAVTGGVTSRRSDMLCNCRRRRARRSGTSMRRRTVCQSRSHLLDVGRLCSQNIFCVSRSTFYMCRMMCMYYVS